MEKICKSLFLIIGFLTVLEFRYVQGLFTGPMMMAFSLISGMICVLFELKKKDVMESLLYMLAASALAMGYVELMF